MIGPLKITIIVSLILGICHPCKADTQQSFEPDPATGAKTWKISSSGVYFSLTQILPIQAQAFYLNRGFTTKQIDSYINSCVFMLVIRNDNAPGRIHFISNNWSVIVGDKNHKLTSVDQWVQQLSTEDTKKSALVAFRWAQFPHEQEYESGGDWNQGMFSVGLPPGSLFNIIASWDNKGKLYKATLQGVQCAE